MTILGLRVAALLEIIVLLGALTLGDQLLGKGDHFASIAPHPFWIVVLLVAAQYGAYEGLLAALAASLIVLWPPLPGLQFGEDIFDYAFRLGLNPAMWLAAALIIGELRSAADRKSHALERQLKEAEERENFLAGAAERLATANRALEDRVAGQLRTVAQLYEAAKAIEKLGPGEVLLGIAGLVRAGISPTKFSVYLLNDGQLEAVFNEGWEPDASYTRLFASNTAIFQEVVTHRRRLCVAYAKDQAILENEAILAGPIQSSETGQVAGMLKIERMDALDFNMGTVENFRIVCEWIGTAYARAKLFERVTALPTPVPIADRPSSETQVPLAS